MASLEGLGDPEEEIEGKREEEVSLDASRKSGNGERNELVGDDSVISGLRH